MSKKIHCFNRLVSIMILIAIISVGCADDQDASSQSADSTAAKSDDPGATGASIASTRGKKEPVELPDSTVTRLALRRSEANTYHHGTQFILELPNSTNDDTLLNRKFGKWYTIYDTLSPRKLNQRNQDRLRNKVYGYLVYHDMVVKYPAAPHTIYFQWFGNGANIDSVVVWIQPAPVFTEPKDTTVTTLTLVSDPPRPKVPPPPPME